MKKKYKIIVAILIPVLLIIGYGIYKYNSIANNIKNVEINKSNENLSISPEKEVEAVEKSIYNFVLYGLDRRDESDPARSDSIIIITVNEKTSEIKLSSIMRDTYVPIAGHGNTKINHAYAYGGPELAISTLNSNFDLNIKDYVAVNFWDAVKIIDLIGGVSIDVHDDEVKHIDGVDAAGIYNLSGAQVLSYSRIRYEAGGDFVRTDRQRTVLAAMFKKIMTLSNAKKYDLIPKIASMVETSMSDEEILKMSTSVITNNISNVEDKRFPVDGEGKKIDGIYYLVTDLEQLKAGLQEFIYN
ncbi:LCP family protein [Clostridium grantii]|uniref:Transcriptional attenuator, LytR family n=1 Tax=Clostridium grantii DSM 8605 TaxID=1121316 RepID=A0A1M5VVV8_9CLOT|nr:LCP family protein [Clostridium grantii]SHH79392.1 transcriptional attenuator, LytR family [Clostridium grantii DSM 8605]